MILWNFTRQLLKQTTFSEANRSKERSAVYQKPAITLRGKGAMRSGCKTCGLWVPLSYSCSTTRTAPKQNEKARPACLL